MINENLIQDVYSTREVKTNKRWIDGKPVYRKVIQGSATNTTNLNISNYIDNYSEVTDMRTRYTLNNDTNVYFGNYSRGGVEQIIIIGANNSAIVFRGTNNFSSFIITLEYTKTTD